MPFSPHGKKGEGDEGDEQFTFVLL